MPHTAPKHPVVSIQRRSSSSTVIDDYLRREADGNSRNDILAAVNAILDAPSEHRIGLGRKANAATS
jgi:hypothetical protein